MITIVGCAFYYTAFGTILIFFIGICQHNEAFFLQLRYLLTDLDALVSDGRVSKAKIKEKLCELVDFYTTIKK